METQLDKIVARECEDSDSDIDDELEAMLYSQVHYGDTMVQEAEGACSVNSSALSTEAVFNIDNTSDVAAASCKIEPGNDSTGTDSNKGPVPLPEVVHFADSETASIKRDKIPPQFDLEAELGIETKKDNNFRSAEVLKKMVINNLNESESDAEGGLNRLSDRPAAKGCSANSKSSSKLAKVVHVLESESEQKECALAPGKERAANRSVPKPLSTVISELPSTDFISLDAFKPKHNNKRTLSCILASHSKSQSPKDIVIVDSDIHSSTTSSTSSDSESSDSKVMQEVSCESESSSATTSDCESLESSSDSDVGVLGNARSCTEESTSKDVTLNLAWNVNHADSKTIKKIEKESALEKHSEKWMVCKADATRSFFNQRRYYTKNNIRCNNCNQQGHLSKLCPEPKKRRNCGLCGMEGHAKARCPNSLCFNCSLPGHTGSRCPRPRRDRFARCARCQIKGHSEQDCPDHWRQYHATVMSSTDLVTKNKLVNPRVYCCNCAKRGHFAYECRDKRMDNFVFPSYPFVIRYNVSDHNHKAKGSWGKQQAASKDAQSRMQVEKTRHAKRSKEKERKKDYHAESKGYEQKKGSLTAQSSSGLRTVTTRMKPSHKLSTEREGESYTSSDPASHQFGKNKLWGSLKKSQRHKTSSSQSIPQLSEFARVFVDQELDPMYQNKKGGRKRSKAYGDQHFDWDGVSIDQQPPSKRRKKAKKADESYMDLVQVPKRRKKEGKWKKGSADEPSTPKRQKKKKAKLEKTCEKEDHSWEATRKAQNKKQYGETSHNKRSKRKQKKGTHPGPRNPKTQDSLVVTSSAGFRTVAKTIRLNNSYRLAQC